MNNNNTSDYFTCHKWKDVFNIYICDMNKCGNRSITAAELLRCECRVNC